MPPKGAATESRVEAMVRVRPFNRRELEIVRQQNDGVCKPIIHMSGRRVALLNHEKNFEEEDAFDFDEAFWSIPREQMGLGEGMDDEVTSRVLAQMGIDHVVGQQEVYEKSGARCVQHAFDGYHSCIFAYGQTGAGKTFTMMGGLDEKGGLDETPKGREMRGLCLRLVEDLFARIQGYKDKGDKTVFKVYLSFIEIYKEKCKDLLVRAGSPKGRKSADEQEKEYADLKVRHTPAEGTYVQGAQRIEIKTAPECFNLMAYGMSCRHTAATKMNDVSSRSHAIFQLTFKQQDPLKGTDTISNINLVDLAGSERVKMSGAEGARLDEATKINKSLSTLRRVIDVLIENAKKKSGQKMVAPYRESMLTWLLMESLGGNSKTIMIAAVSPFYGNFEDTYNTLRYANKAKEIVCKVKRNDEQGAVMVAAMRAEMDRLRQQLQQRSDEQDEAARAQMEADLADAEEQYRQAQEEHEELKRQGSVLRQQAEELERDVQQRAAAADELRQKRDETVLMQEQRTKFEQDAVEAQRMAEELQLNVKEQEENIRRTQAEKDRLAKEEAELRAKEQLTKEEMKTTKQRQMAIAFKNALQLWNDKVFLEELSGQQQSASERLKRMQAQLDEKRAELARHQAEHSELQEVHAEAQTRLEELRREHSEELGQLDEAVRHHSSERQRIEKELEQHRRSIADADVGLREVQKQRDMAKQEHEDEMIVCEQECRRLEQENARTEQELADLESKVSQAKRDYDELKLDHSGLIADNTEAHRELERAQQRHRDSSALNKALRSEVSDATDRLNAAERQRSEMQADIDNMSDQIKKIDRNHRDLKEFVQNRFFPTTASGAAERQQPVSSSPPRPSRIAQHTLKSQQAHAQQQRRAVSPAASRARGAPKGSATQSRPTSSSARRSPQPRRPPGK